MLPPLALEDVPIVFAPPGSRGALVYCCPERATHVRGALGSGTSVLLNIELM